MFIHENVRLWGKEHTITLHLGAAICTVSVMDENPAVAYLSNLSVVRLCRFQGYGNEILSAGIKHAKEMGASMLCLWTKGDSFTKEWYMRHGFKYVTTDTETGMVGLQMDLNDGC